MVLGLEERSLPYGNGERVATYVQNGTEHRKAGLIDEFIVIETGIISSRNTYSFDFSIYESPLQLLSFHISNREQRGGRIEIKINDLQGRQSKTISEFSLETSQFPYAFDPVLILPNYQIQINSNYQIQSCTIFAKQASIIYTDQVSERTNNEQPRR